MLAHNLGSRCRVCLLEQITCGYQTWLLVVRQQIHSPCLSHTPRSLSKVIATNIPLQQYRVYISLLSFFNIPGFRMLIVKVSVALGSPRGGCAPNKASRLPGLATSFSRQHSKEQLLLLRKVRLLRQFSNSHRLCHYVIRLVCGRHFHRHRNHLRMQQCPTNLHRQSRRPNPRK